MNIPTQSQVFAAGRHAFSFGAGVIATAAMWGLVSQTDSATLSEALTHLGNGASEMAKGVTAIIGVIIPLYTAWRAAHNASPAEQVKSVISLPPAEVSDAVKASTAPGAQAELISAVNKATPKVVTK